MSTCFENFIDQHPAALRLVLWQPLSQRPPLESGHLEIETKHGQVAVIDHQTGIVYRLPPRPDDVEPDDVRRWRDLTSALPDAFDARPRFSDIRPLRDGAGQTTAWRFELSTGRSFEFHMHPTHPVLSTGS